MLPRPPIPKPRALEIKSCLNADEKYNDLSVFNRKIWIISNGINTNVKP
jgi:hypothetical protein